MPDSITINCWRLGFLYTSVFSVQISRNANVSALRLAIKAADTTLKDISATNLILYRVSIPCTPQLADHVDALELNGLRINPLDKFKVIFADGPPEDCVHVVIGIPSALQSREVHPPLKSLAAFLQSTTMPAINTISTSSTQTHPYDTLSILIPERAVPFFAIKCPQMASPMIEDLFGRVLPTYQLVDDSETILEKARYFADTFNHTGPIGHESSVWLRTHRVLDICVASLRAVGRSFQYETEVWNNTANVRMDAVVKEGTNIRLAVEDKSPKIFRRHCTEVEINALCGNGDLHMDKEERGFRSIFFKMTIFMVLEHIRWGVINCGTHMRIIRIEYKDERPYAIISEEIVVDNPPPSSIFSLICYMLLTGDSGVPIFETTRRNVPAPPQIVDSSGFGPQTRSQKARQVSLATPAHVTSMMLHTIAAAGRLLVNVPMTRVDKMQTHVTSVWHADVYVKNFIGAGSFGRVFLAEVVIHNLRYGQVVVKLAHAGVETYLHTEARAYAKLRGLCGVGIPRFHGHFTGEYAGMQYWCILLDVCGDPVKTIPNLPLFQRLEIFRILSMIHRQGVMHNDISPMNILSTKSQIRLIDFSAATIDHECPGVGSCCELSGVVTELRLTPLHIQFAILWPLWSDVFNLIIYRLFTIAIASIVFLLLFVFPGPVLWSTYSI